MRLLLAPLPLLLPLLEVTQAATKAAKTTGSTTNSTPTWVDPYTPQEALIVSGYMNGKKLSLVFSDEFEDEGRPFADGSDTRWTAEDRPGVTNAALHYYNSSHVTTQNGKLVIETTRQDAQWVEQDPKTKQNYNFSRFYQSGMVSTWDKFCFTSGMIEISFQLPGKPLQPGLWPAFWMLGNLARPSYSDSTDGIWPWSYDECGTSDEAKEASQVQKLSKCSNGRGRGSPEIDIIEAQPGYVPFTYYNVTFADGTSGPLTVGRPMISSSLQVSPGVASDRRVLTPSLPAEGEWYPALYPLGEEAYGNVSFNDTPRMINNYWYGQVIHDNPEVWQDGLSVNWENPTEFYEQQSIIRVEWQVGKDDGYVRWYKDDKMIYQVTAEMLKSKPGSQDAIAQIPYEAMYLILNTDVSPRWGWPGCARNDTCMQQNPDQCSESGELQCVDCADPACQVCPEQTGWLTDFCAQIQPNRPAQYKIDYIRIYQDTSDPTHTLGCNPPGLPTSDYIKEHWENYTFNPAVNKQPLKKVQHGGGACSQDSQCGNLVSSAAVSSQLRESGQNGNIFNISHIVQGPVRQSYCVKGKCQCPADWTGPTCQSPYIGDYATVESSSSMISLLGSFCILVIGSALLFI